MLKLKSVCKFVLEIEFYKAHDAITQSIIVRTNKRMKFNLSFMIWPIGMHETRNVLQLSSR